VKPYGIPRVFGVSQPDKADLIEFARASRVGHLPSRSGDCHNVRRSAAAKARTRRTFARRARAEGKAACREVAS
jgi:hypothetical protein